MNQMEFNGIIKSGKPGKMFLFTGAESGDKSAALSDFSKSIFAGEEPSVFTFYCNSEFDGALFLDAVENGSLFGGSKLIVLKGVESAGSQIAKFLSEILIPPSIDTSKFEAAFFKNDKNKAEILKYYQQKGDRYQFVKEIKEADKKKLPAIFEASGFCPLAEDTYLAAVTETGEQVPDTVTRLFSQRQQVVFYEMFDNKKTEWIRSQFKKYDIFINEEASDYLLQVVENNKSELEKVIMNVAFSYKENNKDASGKLVVGRDYIETYIYHSKEESPFTLWQALVFKNGSEAFGILDKLFYSDKDGIVPGLLWCARRLVKALDLLNNQKLPPQEVLNQLYIKVPKGIAEMQAAFRNVNFSQAVFIYNSLADLEYYGRFLPADLFKVKLDEFVVKFIGGKTQISFLQGPLLSLQY